MQRLTHPRYWPSWALVALVYGLGRLPFPLLWALGLGLGRVALWLPGSRRRVAQRNLELCFPELPAAERQRLLRRHFGWLGVSALTQGVGWGGSRRRLQRLVRFRGRARLEQLLDAGQPVILLVPHFVGLELGGFAFTALVHPGAYMYQKIRNPVVDWQVRRQRTRYGSFPIERKESLRGLIRVLERGVPLFYLPDQDGGRRGIFVPFCGVAASTVPMLGRFAALADAVVMPIVPRLLPWGRGLELTFGEPLASFPSGDPVADTTRMNQVIEERIRALPEQYFWVHRRFKTRPPGEAPIYPKRRR